MKNGISTSPSSITQIIAGGSDDVIVVTRESKGLFIDTDVHEKGEIIPMYNFMLEEIRSDSAHLSDLSIITFSKRPSDRLVKEAKRMYHNYFYAKNIIYRNLSMNYLVNDFQKDVIKIHYNFLSKYVHLNNANLEIYQIANESSLYSSMEYDEETFSELILLYVTKLMHLYINALVTCYTKTTKVHDTTKYIRIIAELNDSSKDLWFFDNIPLQFDINASDAFKNYLRSVGSEIPSYTIYDTNPLHRLQNMRKSSGV